MTDSLELFILLGKQATGKAVISLIQQVIAAPSIFTFSEILQLAGVKALEASEESAHVQLLRIFSCGTYEQYVSNEAALPGLGPAELTKLKKLSLVSLASQKHELLYSELMTRLALKTTRELEDLVIEAVYSSLIKARLSSRTQSVYIESTIGRDLDPNGSMTELLNPLDSWRDKCDSVLVEIQDSIISTTRHGQTRTQETIQHNRAVDEAKKLSQALASPGGAASSTRSKRSAGFGSLNDEIMVDDEQQLRGWQDALGATANGLAGYGNHKRKIPQRGKR